MRVTKEWLRQAKDRIIARMKELRMMDNDRLKTEAALAFPGRNIHVKGCPNCGADQDLTAPRGVTVYKCRCMAAEIAMARSELTPQALMFDLMLSEIEKVIPTTLTD